MKALDFLDAPDVAAPKRKAVDFLDAPEPEDLFKLEIPKVNAQPVPVDEEKLRAAQGISKEDWDKAKAPFQGPPSQMGFFETLADPESWLQSAKDVASITGKGIVGTTEAGVGLADIATAPAVAISAPALYAAKKLLPAVVAKELPEPLQFGLIGRGLQKATGYDPRLTKEVIGDIESETLKQARKNVDDAKGFSGTVYALLQNPPALAATVGESVPSMMGGAALSRSLPSFLSRIIRAAVGEGAISAGQNLEQVRQGSKTGTVTPGQVNLAVASGTATGLLSILGGKLASRLNLQDVDTLLAEGVSNEVKHGILKRVVGGAISEGLFEEFPQSLQEAISQNLSQGKPWDENVWEQAAQGAVTGAAMGAGGNVPGRIRGAKEVPPQMQGPLATGAILTPRQPQGAQPAPAVPETPKEQLYREAREAAEKSKAEYPPIYKKIVDETGLSESDLDTLGVPHPNLVNHPSDYGDIAKKITANAPGGYLNSLYNKLAGKDQTGKFLWGGTAKNPKLGFDPDVPGQSPDKDAAIKALDAVNKIRKVFGFDPLPDFFNNQPSSPTAPATPAPAGVVEAPKIAQQLSDMGLNGGDAIAVEQGKLSPLEAVKRYFNQGDAAGQFEDLTPAQQEVEFNDMVRRIQLVLEGVPEQPLSPTPSIDIGNGHSIRATQNDEAVKSFVIQRGEMPAGNIMLQNENGRWQVQSIGVSQRGKGNGENAVKAMLQFVPEIYSSGNTSPDAVKMWKRLGAVEVDTADGKRYKLSPTPEVASSKNVPSSEVKPVAGQSRPISDFGQTPGKIGWARVSSANLRDVLDEGKWEDGSELTDADRAAIAERLKVVDEVLAQHQLKQGKKFEEKEAQDIPLFPELQKKAQTPEEEAADRERVRLDRQEFDKKMKQRGDIYRQLVQEEVSPAEFARLQAKQDAAIESTPSLGEPTQHSSYWHNILRDEVRKLPITTETNNKLRSEAEDMIKNPRPSKAKPIGTPSPEAVANFKKVGQEMADNLLNLYKGEPRDTPMLKGLQPERRAIVERYWKAFDELEASRVTAPEPAKPAEVKPFAPDDMVIMHSPHTGEDVEVSYRGPLGDDKAVVWTGKTQMAVPVAWLRHKEAPVEAETFPQRPTLPKDVKKDRDYFKTFSENLDAWKQKVSEWLKTKPENKAIVWSEKGYTDPEQGNVKSLTKNIGDKPWRITSYGWNKAGDALMPLGHREYATREEAMQEEGDGVYKMHDKLPGKVMTEKEIHGWQEMADVPDKSKLVWFKLKGSKTRLVEKMRGTVNLQKFVFDSFDKGKVAFAEQPEFGKNDAKEFYNYLGLEPINISQKYRVGKNPTLHTLIERLPASPIEIENGEQPVRVKNDKTGEISTVMESDLTAVTEGGKPVEKKPAKPRASKTGLTDADGDLYAVVEGYGKLPAFIPDGIRKAQWLKLKKKKSSGGFLTSNEKALYAKLEKFFPADYEDVWGVDGERFRQVYELAKKAGIAFDIFGTPVKKVKNDALGNHLDYLSKLKGRDFKPEDIWDLVEGAAQRRLKGEQQSQPDADDIKQAELKAMASVPSEELTDEQMGELERTPLTRDEEANVDTSFLSPEDEAALAEEKPAAPESNFLKQVKRTGVIELPNGDTVRVSASDAVDGKFDVYQTVDGKREFVSPVEMTLEEAQQFAANHAEKMGEKKPATPEKPKATAYKATLWQGRGAKLEDIYGPDAVAEGRAVPILGPADYYAETKEDAEIYGTATKHEVELQNPFVIDSDAGWRQLLQAAETPALDSRGVEWYEHPERIAPSTVKLNNYLKAQGYDGVIVKLPVGDMNERGESIKGIAESFGHSQVVKFKTEQAVPKLNAGKKPTLLEYAKSKLPKNIADKITDEKQVENYRPQWKKDWPDQVDIGAEVFNLAGEKGVDAERIAKEKADKEAAAKAAKEFEAKNQMDLPGAATPPKAKLISDERAEKLKQSIKDRAKKLGGRMNSFPVDEYAMIFAEAVQLGAYYIQEGAYKFEDFAKQIRDTFGDIFDDKKIRSIYENARVSIESPGSRASVQKSPGLQPGLLKPDERIVTARSEFTKQQDESIIPPELVQHLDKHQRQGAAAAIRSLMERAGFLNADGTGAGKTRQAITVAHYFAKLGKRVVIVTKAETIKQDWKNNTFGGSYAYDSKQMGVKITLARDGDVAPGSIGITTYENLAKVSANTDNNTVLIFDEAHALKNQSQRSKHGLKAIAKAERTMFMSATPADKAEHIQYLTRIGILEGKTIQQQLRDLGMKLVEMEKWEKDSASGQMRKRKVMFWAEDGNISASERHRRFSALFDRMTQNGAMIKREISMQGTHVQVLKLKLPQEAHDVMAKEIETAARAYKMPANSTIDDFQGLRKALVLGNQRRQQEPFKIAQAVMLTERELAEGRQVVIFVSRVNESESGYNERVRTFGGETEVIRHVATWSEGTAKLMREALHAAGIHDIAEIHGNADQASLEAMADFQSGKKRVVIATIESGGTGINLDDTVGNKPRTMIMVTAPFDAVGNVQAAGRIWRLKTMSGSNLIYLFGDTEVDQWNADVIGSKMAQLGSVVEGQVRRLDVSDPEMVSTDDFQEKPGLKREEPTGEKPAGGFPKLEWRTFTTKAGKQRFVATATKPFWNWWNASGKKENPLGVGISNFKGEWQVWSDRQIPEGEGKVEAEETPQPPSGGGDANLASTGSPKKDIFTAEQKKTAEVAAGEPVTQPFILSERVQQVLDKIGVPSAERYLPKRFLGLFKHRNKNIRVQSLADVFTATHEATHYISREFGIGEKLIANTRHGAALRKKLTDIYVEFYPGAKRTHSLEKRVEEGLAVLLENYAYMPEKITKDYPELVNAFIKPTGEFYHPKFTELLGGIGSIIAEHAKLSPEEQIGARIVRGPEVMRRDKGFNLTQRMVFELFNAAEPLVRWAKAAGKSETIDDPTAWYYSWLDRGSIIAEWILGDYTVRFSNEGKIIREPGTIKTYARLIDGKEKEFDSFLVARRVVEDHNRLAEMQQQIMDLESQIEAQIEEAGEPDPKLMAELESLKLKAKKLASVLANDNLNLAASNAVVDRYGDEFAKAVEIYDSINERLVRTALDAGLISRDAANEWLSRKGYASFLKHVNDNLLSESNPYSASSQSKAKAFKQRTGNELSIISPVFNQKTAIYEVISKAAQNRVWRKVLDLGNDNPEVARRFEKIQTQRIPKGDGSFEYPQDRDPNLLRVWVNGRRVFVKPAPEFKAVVDFMHTSDIGVFAELLTLPSALFTRLTTSANPVFMIGNLTVDQFSAWMQSKTGYKPGIEPVKGLKQFLTEYSKLTPEDQKHFQRFLSAGGRRTTLSGSLREATPEKFITGLEKPHGMLGKTAGLIDSGLNMFELPSNFSEYLSRFGEYKRSIDRGESDIVALYRASEVTTPFKLRGNLGGKVGQIWVRSIPYLNAVLQVNYKFGRSIRDNPERMATISSGLATVAFLTAIAMMSSASDRQKRLLRNLQAGDLGRYLYFPHWNGNDLVRFRIPEHVGAITAPIYLYTMSAYNKDKVKFDELLDASTQWVPTQAQFWDPGKVAATSIPKTIQPTVLTWFNKKLYPSVAPIVPYWVERDNLPQNQYNDYTSKTAVELGKILGVSPMKVEFWVRNQFGAVGGFVLGKIQSSPLARQESEMAMAGRIYNEFYSQLELLGKQVKAIKSGKSSFSQKERGEILRDYDMFTDIDDKLKEARKVKNLTEEQRQRIFNMLLKTQMDK